MYRIRTAVLALAVFAAVAAPGVVRVSAPRTTVTIYHAFASSGLIVPHVRVVSGYCWTQSGTSGRYDAWRCFVGNFIYDPCFSSPLQNAKVVVCPHPPNDTGVAIRLTRPLPASFAHTPPTKHLPPWIVQTTSGQVCQFASGASAIDHGVRENYFCGGSNGMALWGYPDRQTEPWTIMETPSDASNLSGAKRVALSRVWI
jgi:hypothetical protein